MTKSINMGEEKIQLIDQQRKLSYSDTPVRDFPNEKAFLKRNLTLWNCFVTVVGCLLGSGLFISPALVAKRTPNSFVALSIWIFAGFISFLGSLCYCELTSLVKKTGSTYIFVHDTYGKYFSLPLLLATVFLISPIGISIVLMTASTYLCAPFLHDIHTLENEWIIRGIALALLIIVTLISCRGVEESSKVQTAIGIMQVGSVVALFITAIYYISKTKNVENFKPKVMFNGTVEALENDFSSISLSIFSALYSFDGWYVIASFAEEIKNPKINLPIVAVIGIPFVTFLYSLINLSCLAMLTHKEIGDTDVVFIDVLEKAGLHYAKYIIPLFACCSCLSNTFSCFYYQSRFMLSGAREGGLPKVFSLIDKELSTPLPCILLQSFCIGLIIVCGINIEVAIQYLNTGLWVEYVLAFTVVLYLRYKRPLAARMYKVWLSTPVFMLLTSLGMVLFLIYKLPWSGVFLAVIIIGSTLHNRFLAGKLEKYSNVIFITKWLIEKTGLVLSGYNMDGW